MKHTSSVQERYILSLHAKASRLQNDVDIYKRENKALKERLQAYEEVVACAKTLEKESREVIKQARAIIAECEEMLMSGKTLDKRYRRQVSVILKEMKA